MRKLLLAIAVTLFAGHLFAQQPAVSVYSGTADPPNCKSPGRNIYLRNDTGTLKICNAGVWTSLNGGVTTVANGGTGQSTYTKGDMLASPGGAALNKLAVGADTFVLTADAASTNGVKWAAAGGGGLATDGSTIGATSVIQPFTNGIKTTATTGLVGVGMTPVAMLDVTAPSTLNAIQAIGTQPAAVAAGNGTTALAGLLITAPNGGDTSHTQANRFGGQGGPINIVSGSGGQQTGASSGTARGGTGGQISINSGNGGAATAVTGTVKGGNGGLFVIGAGTGGTSATSTGGVGGALSVSGGNGGTAAAAASGKGGGITLAAGTGGDNTNAAGTAGVGGDVTITAGAAGAASGGATAGSKGSVIVSGELLTDNQSRVAGDLTAANTTFTNMTGISRTLLATGNYVGELVVKCNNSVAGEGIKFDFNGGSATVTSFWAAANVLVGGSDVLGTGISTSLAGVMNFSTITGETVVVVKISFVVNAAGTIIPRFAENSTAIGTATVELGSFIAIQKSN